MQLAVGLRAGLPAELIRRASSACMSSWPSGCGAGGPAKLCRLDCAALGVPGCIESMAFCATQA